LVTLAVVVAGVVAAFIYFGSSNSAPAAPDPPDLKGSLGIRGGTTFILANQDGFDWTDCEVTVNPAGFSASGFDLTVPKVAARSSREIESTSLASGDGSRFDLETHKMKTFYIRCSTPAGKASTAWSSKDP
jgi:hypothetical protein